MYVMGIHVEGNPGNMASGIRRVEGGMEGEF